MSSSSSVQPYGFVQLGLARGTRAGDRVTNELVIEQSRAQGYEIGYQEGLARASQDQAAAAQRLAQLAESARMENADFIREIERQVVELALAIAEKVVEREVTADPSLVVNVVRKAISEVQDATSVHVRVHPQDHALVDPHWDMMGRTELGEPIILVSDGRVQRGGCIIETKLGHVDGQLSTRLSQVSDLFGALLEGEPT